MEGESAFTIDGGDISQKRLKYDGLSAQKSNNKSEGVFNI